jgi:hypothetical protein
LVVVACTTSGPATPFAGPSQAASASASATPSAIVTSSPTEQPAPGVTTEPTIALSIAPSGTAKPTVTSITATRRASCTSENGTATTGYIKLSWTATDTTGVRVSIDPPAPNLAYDYGYADYPPVGSAEIPFACNPPNHDASGYYHLYVVTTSHTTGYFSYRFMKIYDTAAPPTPGPS